MTHLHDVIISINVRIMTELENFARTKHVTLICEYYSQRLFPFHNASRN